MRKSPSMAKPLASKLGLLKSKRAILIDAPGEISRELAAGASFFGSLTGSFDFIHAFFRSQAKLEARFRVLKSHLAPGGALWISWPKGRQLESDLSLPGIIEMGYRHGLVESKTIGVDSTWSAIKFTFPKKGKVYKNSYGRLPGQG
jgi:hypothetical protein